MSSLGLWFHLSDKLRTALIFIMNWFAVSQMQMCPWEKFNLHLWRAPFQLSHIFREQYYTFVIHINSSCELGLYSNKDVLHHFASCLRFVLPHINEHGCIYIHFASWPKSVGKTVIAAMLLYHSIIVFTAFIVLSLLIHIILKSLKSKM